jgi:hypothetical protein
MLNVMDFVCPACGAKPGEGCRTISNKLMPKPHAKRRQAALDKEHPPEKMESASLGEEPANG